MNTQKELLERPIPGITGKLFGSIVVLLVAGTLAYADIKNGVNSGKAERSEMLQLIRDIGAEAKQDRQLDDARMRAIEIQISECQLRLNFFEKFVEGYNKK